jgi:hypothetical protein
VKKKKWEIHVAAAKYKSKEFIGVERCWINGEIDIIDKWLFVVYIYSLKYEYLGNSNVIKCAVALLCGYAAVRLRCCAVALVIFFIR